MLFLSNDAKRGQGAQFHVGDGYFVTTLSKPSKDLPYLKTDALIGEFYGLNTFLNFLKVHVPDALQGKSSDDRGRNGNFHFFPSYEKAIKTYIENPASIRDFTEKDELLDGGEDSGKSVLYELTGDYIDIDRYIEGVPEVFGQMTDGNPRARRVSIYINLSWVWSASPETINARCARVARLVDWLESQQIRCRITGITSHECDHAEIIVKDFDEPLDLNDLAVINHSDFLRRIIFRWDEYSETWHSGYGNSRVFSEKITKDTFKPQYNNEYAVFVDSRVDSASEVNSDFDDLEEVLADVLVDDNADDKKRSIAVCR